MKVKVIYNPVSGTGAFPSYLDKMIDKAQERNMEISFYRRRGSDDLPEVVKATKEAGYDRIIVSGGDGSVNQLVNELINHELDLPLGIIPAGTANDLAFTLDIPFHIEKAMDIALGDNIKSIDIGKANDRYFVNVASAGLLSDVAHKTDIILKNNIGKMAYYITGVGELPNLKPFEVEIESPSFSYEGKIFFILVMNGQAAGGFTKVAPHASLDDGELDIIIFKECHIVELPPLFLRVMRGEHVNSPHVGYFKTKEVKINTLTEIGTDLDGEKGPLAPLDVECIPGKLRVLVP